MIGLRGRCPIRDAQTKVVYLLLQLQFSGVRAGNDHAFVNALAHCRGKIAGIGCRKLRIQLLSFLLKGRTVPDVVRGLFDALAKVAGGISGCFISPARLCSD